MLVYIKVGSNLSYSFPFSCRKKYFSFCIQTSKKIRNLKTKYGGQPSQKEKKEGEKQRPKNCAIQTDSQSDDNMLSAFSELSKKIIMQFYYMCTLIALNRTFSFFASYMLLLFVFSISVFVFLVHFTYCQYCIKLLTCYSSYREFVG